MTKKELEATVKELQEKVNELEVALEALRRKAADRKPPVGGYGWEPRDLADII